MLTKFIEILKQMSYIPDVLQNQRDYEPLYGGFIRDYENLKGDSRAVTSVFNEKVREYDETNDTYQCHPACKRR